MFSQAGYSDIGCYVNIEIDVIFPLNTGKPKEILFLSLQ